MIDTTMWKVYDLKRGHTLLMDQDWRLVSNILHLMHITLSQVSIEYHTKFLSTEISPPSQLQKLMKNTKDYLEATP